MAGRRTVSFGQAGGGAPLLAQAIRNPQTAFGMQQLAAATEDEPVLSPAYGLTKLARALVGGYFANQGVERERERTSAQRREAGALLTQALGGGGITPPASGPQFGGSAAAIAGGGGMQAAPGAQVHPVTGRPIIQNPDGTGSSERSITIEVADLNGGRPTNIPTIWDGQQLSADDAIRRAIQSGQQFPSFGSTEEAVRAAGQRSDMLGQTGQQPPGPQPPASGGTPQAVAQLNPQQLMQLAATAASSDNPYVQQQAAVLVQMAQMAQQREIAAQRQQHGPVALGPNQRLIDPNTGRVIAGPSGGGAGGAGGGTGAGASGALDFGGQGLEAQMINRYRALDARRAAGTITPQEQQLLTIIEGHLTAERTTMGPNGPTTYTPPPLPRLEAAQPPPQPRPFIDPRGSVAGAELALPSLQQLQGVQPMPTPPQTARAVPAQTATPPAAVPPGSAPLMTTHTPGGGQVQQPAPRPQTMPVEAAGRLAMVQEATRNIQDLRRSILNDQGGVNRQAVASAWANLPGTDGARMRNSLAMAIENRLRIATGAAAPESEVQRYVDLFLPRPWDNDALVQQRMNNLQQFFSGFEQSLTGRPPATPQGSAPAPAAPQSSTPPASGAPRVLRFDSQGRRIQ